VHCDRDGGRRQWRARGSAAEARFLVVGTYVVGVTFSLPRASRRRRGGVACYADGVSAEEERAARRARAAARQAVMTVEVVALGTPERPAYADCTPEERLAAAVRLINYQQALRGRPTPLPRAEWPGEKFVIGTKRG
jgi:hypothetical protein